MTSREIPSVLATAERFSGAVLVVGTFDTKNAELRYVSDMIAASGIRVVTVDVGTRSDANDVEVTAREVAAYHPLDPAAVSTADRGVAVTAMAEAFARLCSTVPDDVRGVIGLGGSSGTALIAAGLRELPVGTPKLLVSTVASGNVSPYVGESDIAMLYSVTDIAGLNAISRQVLGNAARAMAGMATREPGAPDEATQDLVKQAVGLTMFGVTTPCVSQVMQRLGDSFDPLVFHATGAGGRSLEKLVRDGFITGVLDITTTEVCDMVAGGVFAADETRFDAIAETKVPYVGSCGALDMVNFGPPDTVPSRYAARTFYQHNAGVTLMRTTVAECIEIGNFIARKMNACGGPVRFLIPEGGVSAIDADGQPFYSPEADEALFGAIEQGFRTSDTRRIVHLPYHINDPEFADALVGAFHDARKDG